jgi:inhibitor of nuclear factor kappa-B kinase subunit alpha
LEFDLGLKAYKRRKVHGLSAAQKKQRLIRCNRLLRRCASYRVKSIVFSDEKLFTVEEKLNKQNDRIYAVAFEAIPEKFRTVQRFQSRSSIMVWGAVSGQGKFPLVIIDKGVKVNQAYYQRAILERVVKPTAQKMFKNGQWTFQQDSAPAHSAKTNQAFCALLRGQFAGFHQVVGLALVFAGSERYGLRHMGHIGGKGQCYQA